MARPSARRRKTRNGTVTEPGVTGPALEPRPIGSRRNLCERNKTRRFVTTLDHSCLVDCDHTTFAETKIRDGRFPNM
jgi:hypothetical protein